jgi:hypothetical protein
MFENNVYIGKRLPNDRDSSALTILKEDPEEDIVASN